MILEFLFWACLALLSWTYLGYPAWMLLRARRAARRPEAAVGRPKVSVVLAVRNGAARLAARLDDIFMQSYPEELLDVVVALNGCSDESESIARGRAARDERVKVIVSPADEGKAGALNRGVAAATGEVIVFADVRQRFAPDAIERLVAAVQQPGVGAVSGRLVIDGGGAAAAEGMRRYWSMETRLRLAEAATGSVIGVTGAIYAIRRAAFVPIPPGTILDDVYLPLQIAQRGMRVGLEPGAIAFDEPSPSHQSEYRRRVRTLLGNLQLVQLMPQLIRVREPLFVRFVSHKLLRVFSPIFFLGILVSGLLLDGAFYRAVAFGELAVWLLGMVGILSGASLLAVPSAMLMVQVAALEAMLRRRRSAAHVWHA